MSAYRHPVLYVFLFVLIAYAIPAFWIEKGELVLFLNDRHSPEWDIFFKIGSALGNGLIFLPILVVVLFRNNKAGLITTGVFIVQAIFCVLCKQFLYDGALRPKAFFGDSVSLTLVEGVTHYSYNAFPSGHTATAFAAATIIAFFINRWKIAPFIALAPLAVAFSRIYLAQHFYIDTVAGALIGIFSATVIWMAADRIHWPGWAYKRLKIQRPAVSSERV